MRPALSGSTEAPVLPAPAGAAPGGRRLALWLPHLATDRLARRAGPAPGEPAPHAVAALKDNALRLTGLDPRATACGLTPGLPLAEARALIPDLMVSEADPAGDARLLTGLADWCRRYTPLTALDGADGLMLDITGAAHLFGGEKPLLTDLLDRLAGQGFHVRAALADTIGAAHALARRFGPVVAGAEGASGRPTAGTLVPSGRGLAALTPLPLGLLRLPPAAVAAMAKVGLVTVADIIGLPRAPLAARFGRIVLDRLDQALGRLEEPLSPRLAADPYLAERRFAEPIAREEDVLAATRLIARSLARLLEQHGEGGRRFELALYRVDGVVRRIAAGASRPLRDPDAIAALFAERLAAIGDEIDPGFGFDTLTLAVTAADATTPHAPRLDAPAGADDLARLVDRLAARLGAARVITPVPQASHIPERAGPLVPVVEARPEPFAPGRPRPFRLLARPEPIAVMAGVPDGPPSRFRWRRALHEVARADGPERIAAEWWREAEAPTRDYYRVEDAEGRRFWLFREGLYDRETAEPRWFLHGLFA